MSEVRLRPSPQSFPSGTAVQVYEEALPNPDSRLEGKPAGALVAEATVASNGTLNVTGLAAGRFYVGWAASTGGHVRFATPLSSSLLTVDTLFVNVKDHGAVGNGVADDTVAIRTAVSMAASLGGGFVFFPPGVYVSGLITLPSKVTLAGSGVMATVIVLKAGTNDNLVETEGFKALVAGGAGFGPSSFGVRDLVLDGNKAQNEAPVANGGRALAICGGSYTVENVHCRNAHLSGFYSQETHESEATVAIEGSYEASIVNVKCYKNGTAGFTFHGPTSSFISHVMAYNNNEAGTGIFAAGSSSYWANCRSWGFQEYAWQIEGSEHCVNCSAEEGLTAALYISDNKAQWIGGFIYNQGEPTVDMIKVGSAGKEPVEVILEGFRSRYNGENTGSSLNIEHAGDNCRFSGHINHEVAHPAIVGAAKTHTQLDLQVLGATSTVSVHKLAGRTTAIPSPAAELVPLKMAVDELRAAALAAGSTN